MLKTYLHYKDINILIKLFLHPYNSSNIIRKLTIPIFLVKNTNKYIAKIL